MKLYKMSNYCEIIVKSHLDMDWSEWFEGLAVLHNDRGESLFSGRLRDQAAFYGLLVKVRDMGLFLISVKYMADGSLEENGGSDNNS